MKHQLKPPFSLDRESAASSLRVASSSALLVASADMAEARSLALPVTLIEVSGSQDGITFRPDAGTDAGTGGTDLALAQVMLVAIGCLPLSSRGRDELARMGAFWEERTGGPAPQSLAVRGEDLPARRLAVLEWLVLQMSDERQAAAVRSTRLRRELGLLRRQHEETQAGFRDLEMFLYRNVSQKRMLDITLSPITGQLPLTLRGGAQLVQRLPGASAGLSDISIHVANETPPADGILHASLSSLEGGDTLAIWEVPANTLRHGWLRLSLGRALGPDAMTLVLSVSYQGSGTVKLSNSVQHPEQRFWAQMGDHSTPNVPALQIWRWIAGASAPLAATAILPVGGKNRLRRVLGETLTTARDMNDSNHMLRLQPNTSALLVHVLEDRLAGAILSGVALPGARHVYADVRTYHADAPPIEYQIALAPHSAHRPHDGEVPTFRPQFASGWVRLAPQEDGQVHLILPEPLDQPCDVYMLTRLPKGGVNNHFGWSTFANLTLQY
ncbi:DUF6212 domain-containing protein [Ponticaulis profundi]|uniref:DUF6212 domain-containing protein n=1 Tax=Ponticaulis profundi TaxID=2665222 RepID=A0ABW1S804_9PROT